MNKQKQKQTKPNVILIVSSGNDWEIKRKYKTLDNKPAQPKDMGGQQ